MDDRNLGGERVENWRVHVNKREIVNERGFYVAFVTDELTAEQIVRDHNEHQSLSAERERLREILRQCRLEIHGLAQLQICTFNPVVIAMIDAALNEQGKESG